MFQADNFPEKPAKYVYLSLPINAIFCGSELFQNASWQQSGIGQMSPTQDVTVN